MLTTTPHIDSTTGLDEQAEQLLERSRAFRAAAGTPNSSANAPATLDRLDQALGVLSAAWCEIAADAAPGIIERWDRTGDEETPIAVEQELSHEQEAHLMGSLHDVASALACCARTCREARSTIAPLLEARQQGRVPGA